MSITVTRKNPNWVASVLGNVTTVAGKEIACGFPRGKAQAYPDGEQVAQVAADNCFGVGVPQRDFMSYAQDGIIQSTRDIMRRIAQLANLKGEHGQQIDALREAAGLAGAAAIKSAIVDGTYTPNSPASLHPSVGGTNPHGKKSTKPLIDTGHMVQSVTHVVRDKA